MKKTLTIILLVLIAVNTVQAAHYIVGFANNAYDGESANSKTVVIWNPINGILDNITDTIGSTGNSGANNIYMADCELLKTPCNIGDTLNLKIARDSNNYTSETLDMTVTGSGFDVVDNITLNSPPQPTQSSPIDNSNYSTTINFNCSFIDQDNNVNKLSLLGNWTGNWKVNETKTVTPAESYKTFTKDLSEGRYIWGCYAEDNLTTGKYTPINYTITVDKTPPTISSIELNKTRLCGTDIIKVNCTTSDTLTGISTVIIQAINETGEITNYTAQLLSENTYFRDITTAQTGNWTFNCIANDTAGNKANLTSETISSYPLGPELEIETNKIYLDTTPTAENQPINITATVKNTGCGTASNIEVGFYNGPKENGNSIENKTTNIITQESRNISIIWNTKIGISNITVYADITNIYSELDETNNNQTKTIYLRSWQETYGNTTISKILRTANLDNLSAWSQKSNVQGNIFVADKEAEIDWYNLEAIGRTKSGTISTNDFTEIDNSLGMTEYNDSVYQTYTTSGTPKETETFNLFKYQIQNIAVINSTNNTNFTTGILWDKSDSSDEEYDSSEKEDLVFITKVNKNSEGAYGTYDYEIRFPAKLREYDNTNPEEVIFYYELN